MWIDDMTGQTPYKQKEAKQSSPKLAKSKRFIPCYFGAAKLSRRRQFRRQIYVLMTRMKCHEQTKGWLEYAKKIQQD